MASRLLAGFSLSEIEKIRDVLASSFHLPADSQLFRILSILEAGSKSRPFDFSGLSREDWRRLITGLDLYNVSFQNSRVRVWDSQVKEIFDRLSNRFVKRYRIPIYESEGGSK